MKLHASIADLNTDVEICRDGGRVVAIVGGREYEIDLSRSQDGSYSLISNGMIFDCRIEGQPKSGGVLDVFVGTKHYPVTLTDPKRLRGATPAGGHGDEAARIMAPMPGKVVRVLAGVGDQVDKGTGIIVVEAMKMQNEMKSPKAGTVVELNVEVGMTVNGGDVLAVIE